MFKMGELLELNLVLKGDVQGSVEAIRDSIQKIAQTKVKSTVLHSAVGGITESDVQLASVSQGLVIGFNVRADLQARQLAEQKGVSIKIYTVIYELLDDIKATLLGMLAPTRTEKLLGTATVRDTFHIKKVGTVAGLSVSQGKLLRGCNIRLFRDDVKIYEGSLSTLKRFKDDVREVTHGYECGTSFEDFQDVRVDDVVEAYEITETAAVDLS
jgi:translation initiation factor IF-2